MSQPFEHAVTVRFPDVDRAGIAYFNHVFDWCHTTYEEFLNAAFGRFDAAFGGLSWGTPMVRAEADFKAMMRHGDRLRIRMTVHRLGAKSVTFGYAVVGEDDRARAEAKLTHAFIDFDTGRAIAAPQAFLDALKRVFPEP